MEIKKQNKSDDHPVGTPVRPLGTPVTGKTHDDNVRSNNHKSEK